jgi:hypothetical protein
MPIIIAVLAVAQAGALPATTPVPAVRTRSLLLAESFGNGVAHCRPRVARHAALRRNRLATMRSTESIARRW